MATRSSGVHVDASRFFIFLHKQNMRMPANENMRLVDFHRFPNMGRVAAWPSGNVGDPDAEAIDFE